MTVIGPFKVTQGHQFCYWLKAQMWLPKSYLAPFLSYRGLLVRLSLLTRGFQVPLFNFLIWDDSLNSGLQNLASKIRKPLYRVVYNIFWYIEPFRCGSPVWQSDGRTDGQNYDGTTSVRLTSAKIIWKSLFCALFCLSLCECVSDMMLITLNLHWQTFLMWL